MDYEKASDFEVNALLASHLYLECNHAHTVNENENGEAEFWCANVIGDTCHAGKFNYCNNWGDIGLLIEEYGVSLVCTASGGWDCHALSVFGDEERVTQHENPKRAAAICIIKLLEAEKD